MLLLAGCSNAPSPGGGTEDATCGPFVLAAPRMGDRYVYDVLDLPVPLFAGNIASPLGAHMEPVMGSYDGWNDGHATNSWLDTYDLEISFTQPQGDEDRTGTDATAYVVEYALVSSNTRTVVHVEHSARPTSGLMTFDYEVIADGTPFGRGGVFLRSDHSGYPPAMGASLAWGRELSPGFQVEGQLVSSPAARVLDEKPPGLVTKGWEFHEPPEHRLKVVTVGNYTSIGACAAYAAVWDIAGKVGGTSAGSAVHLYTAEVPMPREVRHLGTSMVLKSYEPGTGTAVEAMEMARPASALPPERAWGEAFRGNAFGFPTSLEEAVEAARDDEELQGWLTDEAWMVGFKHSYYPEEEDALVDRWEIFWQREEGGLHVNVTRQVPEPPLLPVLPAEPHLKVSYHMGHEHSGLTRERGSAIGFDEMNDFVVQVFPGVTIDFVICDFDWRLCWLGSQFQTGWDVNLVPETSPGEWIAWHDRLDYWGLAAHMDLGIVAQGRVPMGSLTP
jgi:hypothetical protein